MTLRFLRLFSIFRELERQAGASLRRVTDLEKEVESLKHTKQALQADLTFSRSAYNEAETDKLRLQDRLEAAISDKQHLWGVMQNALENERSALRMQVNHAVQKSGGGIPYPDAHSLPTDAVRPLQTPGPVGRAGRALPSELLARHNNRALEEIVTAFDPLNGR